MYEELIKLLRETSIDFGESDHISVMMIEAADAIEELQKDLERSKDFEAFWQHEAEEALKKFQVAISNEPRWIPVTERLPDAGKKVLVFAYGYDTIAARMCKKTESGYPVFECKGYDGIYREMARAGRISHWMPIPQPPEDGES